MTIKNDMHKSRSGDGLTREQQRVIEELAASNPPVLVDPSLAP